jgi:hypothetical protein
MHGSRSKIPSKKSRQIALLNSGVKGLTRSFGWSQTSSFNYALAYNSVSILKNVVKKLKLENLQILMGLIRNVFGKWGSNIFAKYFRTLKENKMPTIAVLQQL